MLITITAKLFQQVHLINAGINGKRIAIVLNSFTLFDKPLHSKLPVFQLEAGPFDFLLIDKLHDRGVSEKISKRALSCVYSVHKLKVISLQSSSAIKGSICAYSHEQAPDIGIPSVVEN